MVNVNWPTAVAGEADIVSSVSASACHIGGPIGVNPGELALVYGTIMILYFVHFEGNIKNVIRYSLKLAYI